MVYCDINLPKGVFDLFVVNSTQASFFPPPLVPPHCPSPWPGSPSSTFHHWGGLGMAEALPGESFPPSLPSYFHEEHVVIQKLRLVSTAQLPQEGDYVQTSTFKVSYMLWIWVGHMGKQIREAAVWLGSIEAFIWTNIYCTNYYES